MVQSRVKIPASPRLSPRGGGHCSSVCQGLITQPDRGQDKPVSASVRNYFVVCRKVIMISQEGQASRLSHKILVVLTEYGIIGTQSYFNT